jgi:hypothetical protein
MRRRWLLRACIAAALVALVIGLALGVLAWRLSHLAEWAISRALPGVQADIGRLRFQWPGTLVARKLVLTDPKSRHTLLALEAGVVEFDLASLARRQVTRIELFEPRLEMTPEMLEALTGSPARSPSDGRREGSGQGWGVARLVCRYGEFRIAGFGKPDLSVSGKFALEAEAGSPVQEVVVWDVAAARDGSSAFLSLDLLTARFDPARATTAIEKVAVKGGRVLVGTELLAMLGGNGNGGGGSLQTVIEKVEVESLAICLEPSLGLPQPVEFKLNTTLSMVALDMIASQVGEERQFVELEDITVLSPLDPLSRVLSIRALAAEFTLAGLLRGELLSLTATSPTIYLSEDLFAYMEGNGGGGTLPAWTIARFTQVDGRLVLGSGGRLGYGIPLTFRTSAENVALNNLAALRANVALEIPAQTYSLPNYQLEFTALPGQLRFSYPPETGARNLVGTVFLTGLQWRQYRSEKAWISVTFDRQGINGQFGAGAYRGYLGGGFTFFFDTASPWIGWLSGSSLDLKRLTAVASPENVRMSGRADFRLELDARRSEILRVKGDMRTRGGGRLEILKLDELLGRIPVEWPEIKQSATKLSLATLRDFDFTSCTSDFWFVEGQGRMDLRLQGPLGSRTFNIVLHADDSAQGRWKGRKGP